MAISENNNALMIILWLRKQLCSPHPVHHSCSVFSIYPLCWYTAQILTCDTITPVDSTLLQETFWHVTGVTNNLNDGSLSLSALVRRVSEPACIIPATWSWHTEMQRSILLMILITPVLLLLWHVREDFGGESDGRLMFSAHFN